MGYAYGTRGAPEVGKGAPGLPQRVTTIGTDPAGAPLQTILLRADTVFLTPGWATYARVTAQGKGGRGSTSANANGAHGGAGGGSAASGIEQVSPATPIEITFRSLATSANFLNYQLRGGNGGDATNTAGGAPGIGSGGLINFNGGPGGTSSSSTGGASGGGAAGRGGDGEAGSSSAGINRGGDSGPGDSYVTGGGAGGAGQDAGGIRFGGLSRTDASPLGAVLVGKSTAPNDSAQTPTTCDGGDGGGGSGGTVGGLSNTPGAGWVLIELW